MKYLANLYISCLLMVISCLSARAQSFSMAHDTVWITTGGTTSMTFPDSVINLTSSGAIIDWKVIATDFPADWQMASGICDPAACFEGSSLWPSTGLTTFGFGPGTRAYYLYIDFPSTTSAGCYYLRVRLHNQAIPTDTATATFIVCKSSVSVPAINTMNEVSLYPNPVVNLLNVNYSAAADIRSIAIYSIIGRQVSLFKTGSATGASLNLENIPSGVYFVRLLNANGDAVTTRKFIKK